MGALHAGHAALIRRGVELARERELSGGCVVSIFVNPSQFNDPADFARYPKTFEADAAMCEAAGASLVFAPGVDDVYPPGVEIATPPLPAVAAGPGLEDAFRPGHFAGVCRVVKRLFEIVRPVASVFGEKDWQQLQVITAMVRNLSMPIEIIPGPTVREDDGLAMSSRNRFLTPADRVRALALRRALHAAQSASTPADAQAAMTSVLAADSIVADYAVVRDAQTLLAPDPSGARPHRALITARVGSVRLLDNAAWAPRSV
ncbi:MAG: pantoate--beta-alanine ligase [Planctomycetes bacterium]|nr:pantoate--beta-alanine ligase [Planctomycetota bacterium]